ncbi:MAG TPA: ribosome-associated translation inhibitor RaiA [Candidatus Sulfomarinibacteraceae bacterium]|nr:ribosome-associated translation inhibitor RaiA [Candidatus Sulfomarinibacteraceae bacterium]
MEILIHSHNMDVSDRLQQYVEKKTMRLDRYMPNLTEVRVDLAEENTRSAVERHVAQITIRDDRGTILRAEERSNDMFASVDIVVDKLYRQINRYRGKRRRNRRGGNNDAAAFEPLPVDEAILEEEADAREIVRRKRFPLHPMSVEEAVDQMELLGHDFFVFFNPDEQAVNVVYKRHDGNYGLLLPELD